MMARLVLALGLVGSLGAALTGCTTRSEGPGSFQGVVEYDERRLGFPLGGVIASVPVVEGQRVALGDPLGALDDQLERSQRDGRAAEVAAAEARLALLQAGSRPELVRSARSRLAGALAAERSASSRLKDERKLSRAGAVPASGIVDREAVFAEALAGRRALEEELHVLRSGARPEETAAARAAVEAARAGLAASDTRLTQHALKAPMAGIVLDVHVRAGEVVGAGAPVVTMADTSRPFVDVFVPEARVASVVVGAAAQVRIDSLSAPVAGTIEHIARRTEFTPTYVFSEKERPNLVVRVRVRIAPPSGVALPAGVPAFVTVAGTS